MKKLLTTAFCLSMLTFCIQGANAETTKPTKVGPQGQKMEYRQRQPKPSLDEVLKLTDKQKEQAKANRIAGRKEMKPIMDEIRAKKEAILDIKDSDLPEAEQKEKIKALQNDIKVLSVKANEVREKNMENFEKILTKEQKAKLKELKQNKNSHGCPKCRIKQPAPIN